MMMNRRCDVSTLGAVLSNLLFGGSFDHYFGGNRRIAYLFERDHFSSYFLAFVDDSLFLIVRHKRIKNGEGLRTS